MKVLTSKFNTKYDTAPFSMIKNEDFLPAFLEGIALAKNEIDAIVTNKDKPTFENTIEALDFSGYALDRISSIFFNLNSAETSDEIQKIAQEVSPLLSEFGNDITLNADLFAKVKVSPETVPICPKTKKSFFEKSTKNYRKQVLSLAKMY
jgi:Zn-dependent oligopeptidase